MAQLGRETTGVKKMVSTWAKGCGSENTRLSQFGGGGGKPWGYGCAKSLVLSKIREALGLDRVGGWVGRSKSVSVPILASECRHRDAWCCVWRRRS